MYRLSCKIRNNPDFGPVLESRTLDAPACGCEYHYASTPIYKDEASLAEHFAEHVAAHAEYRCPHD